MRRIRVMIVEDSDVVRELLEHVVGSDPRLEVAASVPTAEEALRLLRRARPDVISMDIRLPGMNGFEATRRIMSERPTPIVVVSASVESEDLKISMNALRSGALSVVEKPVGASHADYAVLADRLCTQLAIMSEVKVIRQHSPRGLPAALRSPPPGGASSGAVPPGPFSVVGMAASTGGPGAVARVLGDLGPRFPLPILLVQHITDSFLDGFVGWLGGVSPLPVVRAADGAAPEAGTVHVAPAGRHLILDGGRLRLTSGDPVCLQRPSATVLFGSLARAAGPRALGVLLTGMGNDGAEGLRELRQSGGYTLAEDASTAVVYGMPGAAMECGAVCEALPLGSIGPRLRDAAGPAGSPAGSPP